MKSLLALLILGLFLMSANAQTMDDLEADCQKLSAIVAKGDRAYRNKDYDKAREHYESQVTWSELCLDDRGKIATAYNNVALTYFHQKAYGKARAWLLLAPDDPKSVYNLKKLEPHFSELSTAVEGEYWEYQGQGVWSVFVVKRSGDQYQIDFDGYRPLRVVPYYGVNMGSFSFKTSFEGRQGHYQMNEEGDYGDCEFRFTFKKLELIVERLSGDQCGFGYGVYAEGTYQKVL